MSAWSSHSSADGGTGSAGPGSLASNELLPEDKAALAMRAKRIVSATGCNAEMRALATSDKGLADGAERSGPECPLVVEDLKYDVQLADHGGLGL